MGTMHRPFLLCLVLFFLVLLCGGLDAPPPRAAHAQSQSVTRFPRSSQNYVSLGGVASWGRLADVFVKDSVGAEITLKESEASFVLIMTDFNFALPAGALVTGVEATFTRASNPDSGFLVDKALFIVDGGVPVPETNILSPQFGGITPITWAYPDPLAFRDDVYGGPTQSWNRILTWYNASRVNNPLFGIALSVIRGGFPASSLRTGFLDSVAMTIHYGAAGPPVCLTCADLGMECGGPYGDGCGGTVTCPACTGGLQCKYGLCFDPATCETCQSLGKSCGIWEDNCTSVINCGTCQGNSSCPSPSCRADGTCCCPEFCGTKNCGTWTDLCSLSLYGPCGQCNGTEYCDLSGQCQPGVPVCSNATKCFSLGFECDRWNVSVSECPSGWVDCGQCSTTEICSFGTCVLRCVAQDPCEQRGGSYYCGTWTDTCNVTSTCPGMCTPPWICDPSTGQCIDGQTRPVVRSRTAPKSFTRVSFTGPPPMNTYTFIQSPTTVIPMLRTTSPLLPTTPTCRVGTLDCSCTAGGLCEYPLTCHQNSCGNLSDVSSAPAPHSNIWTMFF